MIYILIILLPTFFIYARYYLIVISSASEKLESTAKNAKTVQQTCLRRLFVQHVPTDAIKDTHFNLVQCVCADVNTEKLGKYFLKVMQY